MIITVADLIGETFCQTFFPIEGKISWTYGSRLVRIFFRARIKRDPLWSDFSILYHNDHSFWHCICVDNLEVTDHSSKAFRTAARPVVTSPGKDTCEFSCFSNYQFDKKMWIKCRETWEMPGIGGRKQEYKIAKVQNCLTKFLTDLSDCTQRCVNVKVLSQHFDLVMLHWRTFFSV